MTLKRDNVIKELNDFKINEFSNIKFQELPYVKKINLQGDPNNNNFIVACGKILNTLLPTDPNTFTSYEQIKIIWLGPNEWLITDESKNNINLFIKLHNLLGDKESSVTDVSENKTVLRVEGKKLFTLLSKFLFLNLEKSFKNQSSVAQTLFVKVPILIVRIFKDYTEEPKLDLIVNRSHAKYIYDLLVDGTKNLDF